MTDAQQRTNSGEHGKPRQSRRGKDKTPWPSELMHDELCATRFGMNAECDCGAVVERRGPHEVGKPCPRKPSMTVTTRDFERQKCGACGTELLSLDAYMDRGGR